MIIFTEGWQWPNEQMIKFCWRYASGIRIWIRIRIRIDTGKTYLGGGMYCPIDAVFRHKAANQ